MQLNCPRCIPVFELSTPISCFSPGSERSNFEHVVRFGAYFRQSDSRRIARYFCRRCKRSFSRATLSPEFGQLKRRLNHQILKRFCTTASQRDIARTLKTNRKTVARKLDFLALRSRVSMAKQIRNSPPSLQSQIYFDEMETFEHTKCKPLSIPIAVSEKDRKILALGVARMPAKGLLAQVSRKRYGSRINERPAVLREFFERLRPYVGDQTQLISDQNPHYPQILRRVFPHTAHIRHKGRDGCVTGQGELKRGGQDPLFDLNHTCAMLRAHVSRLLRRSWVTTKSPDRLLAHLYVYAHFHNSVLTPKTKANHSTSTPGGASL